MSFLSRLIGGDKPQSGAPSSGTAVDANALYEMAERHFEEGRDATIERMQREAAFQWWGLTVGLKSFDDAWLSQGLAEYSAFSLRESQLDSAKLDALRRERQL